MPRLGEPLHSKYLAFQVFAVCPGINRPGCYSGSELEFETKTLCLTHYHQTICSLLALLRFALAAMFLTHTRPRQRMSLVYALLILFCEAQDVLDATLYSVAETRRHVEVSLPPHLSFPKAAIVKALA